MKLLFEGFLALLLLLSAAADAQEGRLYRVGAIYPQSPERTASEESGRRIIEAEMARLGYVEGRNVVYERRFADSDFTRFPALAEELVRREVDIIIAFTTTAALAAKRVTSTIPIVVTSSGDAVGSGLVASLARPGGNVTGNSFLGTELAEKQLQLVRELAPSARRIALVANDALPPERLFFARMRELGGQLDLDIAFVDVRGAADFAGAVAEIGRLGAEAAIFAPAGFHDRSSDRGALLKVSADLRIPMLYFRREFVAEGGLVAYGPSFPALYRQAAATVDRILRGANPAELPVLQPSQFEMVVNLGTAKRLGIAVPTSVLARADEVIE